MFVDYSVIVTRHKSTVFIVPKLTLINV